MPKVTFVSPTGERTTLEPPAGLSLLEIARKYNIDIEGACEGSLACSTCHVIVDAEWFDALDEATEDEEDMLDLAYAVERTSRLSCQIELTEEMDGLTVKIPSESRDMSGL